MITATSKWRDLAPMILRQRLVVEGTCREPITDERIRSYLSGLSSVCGMKALMEPATHRSDTHGWPGWIHWESWAPISMRGRNQCCSLASISIPASGSTPLQSQSSRATYFDTVEVVVKEF